MMSWKRKLAIVFAGTVALVGAVAILFLPTPTQDLAKDLVRKSMTENTAPREAKPLPALSDASIVIKKKAHTLEVYDGATLVKTYTVAFGFTPQGDKEIEGDGKTPEGEFYIFTKNPKSQFHLSLGISYPSDEDARRGLAAGIISKGEHDQIVKAVTSRKWPPQKTALGGEIYIHGGGVGRDWTWGCIAMKDPDVEEIYNAIAIGTKITILP